MTDTMTRDDDDLDGNDASDDRSRDIRRLREKAQMADEAAKERDAARRELAIIKSGIDTDSKAGKLFLKAYDGELTPEALKAAAQEYDVPFVGQSTEGATDQNGTSSEGDAGQSGDEGTEDTGSRERADLANGAPADTGVDKHPSDLANEAAQRAREAGLPSDKVQGEWIAAKARSALGGDKRALVE